MPEVRNKRPRTRWALALLGLVLVAVNTPIAASSNLVSVGDTTIGTTTTYTVTFKTAQSIGSGADLINFNSNNGADLSGANYIGVTGGSGLVMTQASASASLVVLNVSAGSAATGTVLSLEFSNVVNPAIEGPARITRLGRSMAWRSHLSLCSSPSREQPTPAPTNRSWLIPSATGWEQLHWKKASRPPRFRRTSMQCSRMPTEIL